VIKVALKPDAELEKELVALVSAARTIDAIRTYHKASGESLKQSAQVVGRLDEELKTESPDKLTDYWEIPDETRKLFVNFELENINLKVEGQIFDLHNKFVLQGYAYDSPKRIFVLSFYSEAYNVGQVQTDLKLIFHNVSFLRVHDKPFDGKFDGENVSFNKMDMEVYFNKMEVVSSMFMKPEIALQVEQELIEFQVDEELAASADEGREADANYIENIIADIDWSQYLYIDFSWGAEILICAETVEVTYQQSAVPE